MKGLHSESNYQKYLCRFVILVSFVFSTLEAFAQIDCNPSTHVCLRILSVDQEELVGVNVVIKDKFYSSTDINGYTNLPIEFRNDSLTLSFLGFATKQLAISDLTRRLNIIALDQEGKDLDEIVILGRREVRREDIPQRIQVLSKAKIDQLHASTSADILEKSGALYVQKSQFGGGSPIIRGFEANRILLVADNVRMNNAIYRSGHLQNAITLDANLLSHVEVLLGPNSLLYGSDALGGVVHFISKKPGLSGSPGNSQSELNYDLRYGTAAKEKALHVDFNMGRGKFGMLTSVSISDFNDLRSGANTPKDYPDFGKRLFFAERQDGRDTLIQNSDPFLQIGTAYQQVDLAQKFRYRCNAFWTFQLNLQYSTTSDIPRYDALIEPGQVEESLRWSEWFYGPQKRTLTSASADWNKPSRFWDDAKFILSTQSIDEERNSRRFQSDIRSQNKERVRVWSATADFTKQLDSILLGSFLKYGVDFTFNKVNSTAKETNLLDSTENSVFVLTRYPGEKAKLNSAAVYGVLENEFFEGRLHAEAGIRLGVEKVSMQYSFNPFVIWPREYLEVVNRSVGVITASTGAVFKYRPDLTMRGTLGSAYRNPNIDDQGKIRINNQQIQIPNLELKPERSFSAEVGIDKKLSLPGPLTESRVRADFFYTFLSNEVIRQLASLPSGDTTIQSEGERLRTVANVNGNNARIRGFFFEFDTRIRRDFFFRTNFNYTKGVSVLEDGTSQPSAHIPPFFGLMSLSYNQTKWNARFDLRYNGAKKIENYAPNSSDNPELATPEGSLSWATVNLYFDYKLRDEISLSFGLENIFNKYYRTFSSGVSASGRNLSLRLRGTLR